MQATHEPRPATAVWRRKAADWFLNSGIQSPHGGVSRYYRGDSGARLADSTEITGYAIAGLLALGLRNEAERAGRFLLDRAWDPGLEIFPFELYSSAGSAYFFDSGIISRGLLRLSEATGESRYRLAAVAAAKSMHRHFEASAGYHPILELPSLTPLLYSDWWSTRPGCFQLKAALAWCEFGGPGDPYYERQLRFALDTADELLAIETDPLKLMDRLHPYCYFLEGLMPVASEHSKVLRQGIETIGAHLHRLAPRFCRSDVYAQLLRIRLLADSTGLVQLDRSAAADEAAQLATMQIDSEDRRMDGAFAFGRRDGVLIPHANPVSTVFGVQALDWWREFAAGTFGAGWRQLI